MPRQESRRVDEEKAKEWWVMCCRVGASSSSESSNSMAQVQCPAGFSVAPGFAAVLAEVSGRAAVRDDNNIDVLKCTDLSSFSAEGEYVAIAHKGLVTS